MLSDLITNIFVLVCVLVIRQTTEIDEAAHAWVMENGLFYNS